MNTIYWRMNATRGDANLHPGVNLLSGAYLHPGANCAHEHGFSQLIITNCLLYVSALCLVYKPYNKDFEEKKTQTIRPIFI